MKLNKIFTEILSTFSKKKLYASIEESKVKEIEITNKQFKKIDLSEKEENIDNLKLIIELISEKLIKLSKQNIDEINIELIISLKNNLNEILDKLSKKEIKLEYDFVFNQIRSIYKHFINLLTNESWQSPDIINSGIVQHNFSQDNVQTFYNDYQRYKINTFKLEKIYEEKFNDIDDVRKKVYFFNSGMASFNTLIRSFRDFDKSLKVVGQNIYFESLAFLKNCSNTSFFPDTDINRIINFIDIEKPKYLFFDSITNSYYLYQFNFVELFNYYIENPPSENVNIIIDTTLTFNNFQLSDFFNHNFPDNLNVFLFRSLQKFDQLGMDLVSGGILVHYGSDKLNISEFRKFGTNPTEISLETIYNFHSLDFEARYKKHCSNSFIIAKYLRRLTEQENSIIKEVSYNFDDKYLTPLLFFRLDEKLELKDYNFFIKKLIQCCKKEKINIAFGTSFGFNFSRVMVTTLPNSSDICIRLSPGIETLADLYRLLEVIKQLSINFINKLKNAYKDLKIETYSLRVNFIDDYFNNILKIKEVSETDLKNLLPMFKTIYKELQKFLNYKQSKNFPKEEIEKLITKTLEKVRVLNNNDLNKRLLQIYSELFKLS